MAFKKLVAKYLKDAVPKVLQFTTSGKDRIPDPDPYMPYENMPDTLRNRLLMFIAKWSRTALEFETGKTNKQPKPAEMLDDRSLIKWETGDPANNQGREVLRIAKELISAANDGSPPTVLDPFSGGGAIPLEAPLRQAQALVKKYRLGGWVTVALEGRQVVWREDAAVRAGAAQLDGCYVVETDVPREAATAEAFMMSSSS